MNNQQSFAGECYGCHNPKEIIGVVCWSTQKSGDIYIKRSWRWFCNKCCDIFNIRKNRTTSKSQEVEKMVQLLERAQAYEPAGKLKNISELNSIPIAIDVTEKIFAQGTDKEFKAEIFTINGEDYKMPVTVISSLKAILEENPKLKTFKVKKSGTGLGTEYTVIPLS